MAPLLTNVLQRTTLVSRVSEAQNEAERRQNAHAAKTRLRAAMAHAGVSRIRSASGEYREAQDIEKPAPITAAKRLLFTAKNVRVLQVPQLSIVNLLIGARQPKIG